MDERYEFSADPARVDRARVHRWLAEQSYWAKGRSREKQDAAIDGSWPYGVYEREGGRQVGFARVVTDGATFAWLADVFVDPDVRGQGVGVALVEGVLADLEPRGLRRVVLATADAHTLYERFGFTSLVDPERWMVRGAPVDPAR